MELKVCEEKDRGKRIDRIEQTQSRTDTKIENYNTNIEFYR
ncbi:hypothetical protein CBB_1738 [Clostridium botulinum Bf]|nr:hypothetical protein T257_266 [Clostridium botulinum CDC_297]AJE11027.1 hypothetical protein T259_2916 [Clostridium botulinum CDC_1436]EDT86363.1 hypothetical protein CBB_1738 [Clostridium botulinum Bf]EPS53161.1 hypothetical protein CFSAN002368_00030 [Clostridium botulinum A1 str. CFSAN002368]